MKGRSLFWLAFIVSIIVLTWKDITTCHDLPWPPRYIGAALTFGMLDIFSHFSEELAGVVAIGIVMAILINKGFEANCNHAEATAQPASYEQIIPNQGTTLA